MKPCAAVATEGMCRPRTGGGSGRFPLWSLLSLAPLPRKRHLDDWR